MPDLTLEQVQDAGRFAWHKDGRLVYAPGERLPSLWAPWDRGGVYSYNTGAGEPHTGWHHLEGCDCEFCK